jgi:hypothetical protein
VQDCAVPRQVREKGHDARAGWDGKFSPDIVECLVEVALVGADTARAIREERVDGLTLLERQRPVPDGAPRRGRVIQRRWLPL